MMPITFLTKGEMFSNANLVTYLLCINILRSGSKQQNVVYEMLQLKSCKIYFV